MSVSLVGVFDRDVSGLFLAVYALKQQAREKVSVLIFMAVE
jgi:hypothetical protein